MTGSEAGGRRWSVGAMVSAALAARHDPAAQIRNVDLLAVLIALLLPWSTSGVAIASMLWLAALFWAFDPRAFLQSLKRPVCIWPIALFVLAVIGTLWSEATWSARLQGIGPTVKLLMLPLLLYHFERSQRGHWVFVAFLVSCTLLMAMSWIVEFRPGLALTVREEGITRGIFVKNYIAQSQEFALCAVALAYPVGKLLFARRTSMALLLAAAALGFVSNMVFVIVSRTVLVTMPIMIAVLGWMKLRLRTNLLILGALAILAIAAWFGSPQLQGAVSRFSSDYQQYMQTGRATSIAERLQYWKSGLGFVADAPWLGHGTGSTKGLYEKAAGLPGWVAGVRVVPNPHNQTLYVAIQWGIPGIAILYAMWISHFLLFRGGGLAGWVGMAVVVQNILTSLFNSHIFDFHEGWMYVLGVGVAGGMMLRQREESR